MTDAPGTKDKNRPRHKIKVSHQTPGRVRLKIPSAKGDPEAMARIAESLAHGPGVQKVTANPLTGSVVVKYDPSRRRDVQAHLSASLGLDREPPMTPIDRLIDNIRREIEFLARHSRTAARIVDFFARFDARIKRRTRRFIDLKIILAGAIVAGILLEVSMSAATPIWIALAVFGVNHVVHLRRGPLDGKAEPRAVPA